MRLLLKAANVICPGSSLPQGVHDVLIDNGKLVAATAITSRPDKTIDASNHVLMPNGVDLHTHIGGGKANLSRLLLFEREQAIRPKFVGEHTQSLSSPVPNTLETGLRYLQLGYTACFEPAVLASGARHAHCEMIDTPHLDTGGYVVLGNEELLLDRLANKATDEEVRDYVAWMLQSTQCRAVKVVNAGGISAFKYNQRHLDVDDEHSHWGLTPRAILYRLAKAIDELGLPHPLHVHCSNLGTAGNIASTLATIDAVTGHRLHLTHTQFHAYGSDGPFGFSSAASQLADRVNAQPELSIDVGQVFFGQTATLSADVMHQFRNRRLAKPRKVIFQESDCQAGCGVLPFRYREDQFVNALQWAIGLELFLLVKNPWQIFLTTDHPNGAPFTAYPHLIKLLCSHDFRMEIFEQLHPAVKEWSNLASLTREYTLEEIAIITRSGPVKSLGLSDTYDAKLGAAASFTLFHKDNDLEKMFCEAAMVVKNGSIVWQNGQASGTTAKSIYSCPLSDRYVLPKTFEQQWSRYNEIPTKSFAISDDELVRQRVQLHTMKAIA